jgi:hypothetical protein
MALADALAASGDEGANPLRERVRQLQRPETKLDVVFDRQLRLSGVSGLVGVHHPGDLLRYQLFWQNIPGGVVRPTVFIHIRDAKRIVCQDDRGVAEGLPLNNSRDMDADGWLTSHVGEIQIPEDTAPGHYWINLGVWDSDNGRHFRARTALPQNGDHVVRLPIDFVVAPRGA